MASSGRAAAVVALAAGSVSAESQAAPVPADRDGQPNEDRWVALTDDGVTVLAVADGMGGIPGGGVAASRAVVGLLSLVADGVAGQLPAANSGAGAGLGADVGAVLAAAFATADRGVRTLSSRPDSGFDPRGPGTTLTAAVIAGDRLRLAHAGDSSCWLFRRGRLCRLTEQHTAAAVLVASGAVAASSLAARRLDSLLTRYLGMPGTLHPQLTEVRLRAGDRVLLATDGLTRSMRVGQLGALLRDQGVSAASLVAAAVAAGARDDVTAVLATVRPAGSLGSKTYPQYSDDSAGIVGAEPAGPPWAPPPARGLAAAAAELPVGWAGRAAVAGR